jgi:hypothetical protein
VIDIDLGDAFIRHRGAAPGLGAAHCRRRAHRRHRRTCSGCSATTVKRRIAEVLDLLEAALG